MVQDNLLDAKLLRLSSHDYFTLRDANQGVLITGSPGSGKTTGSGATIRGSFLRVGMGGLVLCAKPEEAASWRQACAQHGRSGSLIELDGSGPILNFIAYELARHGPHGLNSVIECLMRVLEAARNAGAEPGRAGERFWEDTTRQVLRNTIPILYAATGTVRIGDVLKFLRSAPQAPGDLSDPDWQRGSFFFKCFRDAADRIDDATGDRIVSYWSQDYARLDPKTRGNISISLTTALDRFNHGWLQTAFCGETTVVPELSFHGAIFLLNMPALTLNDDGIIAQQLIKFIWQRAVLARNALDPSQQQRPVFLWADEAQYFINSFDAEYLSTCRGSRACTVFLSQSLPTFYATIGGEHPRERVQHLLGNFATKIWHSNSCAETNRWAAETIGQVVKRRANFSEGEGTSSNHGMNMGEGSNWGTQSSSGGTVGSSSSSQGGSSSNSGSSWSSGGSQGENDSQGRNRGYGSSSNISQGYSEQMGYVLEPGDFGRILKTGGPANGNRVSAIWYQAGRRFQQSGGNSMLAEFVQ
ncbi:MAG TPA: hypothetical protein VGO55_05710 [Allosphingosinicella sp.]|jgi:hypothetical protein|nr:hypothetical protein [Allosphingosinicella sp.]